MKNDFLQQLFSLEGKVALITGAAGGIGRVFAQGMSKAGAQVALADINVTATATVTENIRGTGKKAEAFALDLADNRSIDELVKQVVAVFGQIDILINCAAINKREPILEVEAETFDKIIAVNLRGLYQLSQSVVRIMKEQGGGKIINVSSLNSTMALGGVSVYGATKGAVSQLTMGMAVEWAQYNIQVNAIAPGFMRTALTVSLWQDAEKVAWMKSRIAAGRPGEPEELLGMALLLAAPASSYMTGQTYFVDGGVTAGGNPW